MNNKNVNTKNFDNKEIRDKAIKDFLKKPVNKETFNLLGKKEELTEKILRKGIDTSMFDLKSCLYALYVWKCLIWAENPNNPSAYDCGGACRIKVIKDDDINWDEYQEYVQRQCGRYDSNNRLMVDQCYLIEGFDAQAQNLIKAFYLLDYIFKQVNQSFDTYTTETYDNDFSNVDQKVIDKPFTHDREMFYRYSDTIWEYIEDKNAIAFTEMPWAPIRFIGVWIDYQDTLNRWKETVPSGLKLSLQCGHTLMEQDLQKRESCSQLFDYDTRIESGYLDHKFTKHLEKPKGESTDMLDVFDYYANSFDIKTFNNDPEQMDVLLNFDLNTLDISSHIPEKFKESYETLINLIATFAKKPKNKSGKEQKATKQTKTKGTKNGR